MLSPIKNALTSQYNRFKIYIANSTWMIADKIINMALNLGIMIILANHLGPTQLGVFYYAISLFSLFAVAGHAGLSGLITRNLVKEPNNADEILGTSFVIKTAGYALGFILIVTTALLSENKSNNDFWVITIIASGLVLKPFEVIDFWFLAHLNAKQSTISRLIGSTSSHALKIIFIFLQLELFYLAIAHVTQTIVNTFFYILFYKGKSKASILKWKFSRKQASNLLSSGWKIYIGTIFAVIYLKIDQIMLRWIDGQEAVGIYAVAASLSEAWYFLPTAIVASLFPKLIALQDNDKKTFDIRLQQIFSFLFIIAICVAIIVTACSSYIFSIFFDEPYEQSARILTIHIWAAPFIFMRSLLSKWILIEDALMFSLITQGFGAFANIALNFWLIPNFGGIGAAYATVISYAIASYLALLFTRKTRLIFVMMTKAAVGAPLSLINWILKK